MEIVIGLARCYLWLAAFGFPIALMFFIGARAGHHQSYKTGYDDGFADAEDEALKGL